MLGSVCFSCTALVRPDPNKTVSPNCTIASIENPSWSQTEMWKETSTIENLLGLTVIKEQEEGKAGKGGKPSFFKKKQTLPNRDERKHHFLVLQVSNS